MKGVKKAYLCFGMFVMIDRLIASGIKWVRVCYHNPVGVKVSVLVLNRLLNDEKIHGQREHE